MYSIILVGIFLNIPQRMYGVISSPNSQKIVTFLWQIFLEFQVQTVNCERLLGC